MAWTPETGQQRTWRRELTCERGVIVARVYPGRRGAWCAETTVRDEPGSMLVTEHRGQDAARAAKTAAWRRARGIAAGRDPTARGWGGRRTAAGTTNTVLMQARVPVELGRLITSAAEARGESVPAYLGTVLVLAWAMR